MYVGGAAAGNFAGAEAAEAEVGRIVVVAEGVGSIAAASWRGLQMAEEADTAVAAVAEGRWGGQGSQIFRWALVGGVSGCRGRVIYERTWIVGRSMGRGASIVGRWGRCAGHGDC